MKKRFLYIILKTYLKLSRWVDAKIQSRICIPFFEGLHPVNVFHYRSEFYKMNVNKNDNIIDLACGTGKSFMQNQTRSAQHRIS